MKNKIIIYILLIVVILLGTILFDYAFPDIDIQRGLAAILSMYCFSFVTVILVMYELKKDKENNDNK